MIHMKNVGRQELVTQLIRKMAPPLGKSGSDASNAGSHD
jgi:hypothetical protein